MIFVFLLLFALAIAAFFRTPKGRGIIGEWRVRRVIGKTKEGVQYVINDCVVIYGGKSSQIDHILIARNGVFVIETKNYSGRIYGNEFAHEWTQVLKFGSVKNKIYNPIKQNATHIYRLQEILGNVPMRSVVVFVQNNTQFLSTKKVISLKKLRSVLKKGEPVLSLQQMKTIYDKLKKQTENCHVTQKQHIAGIQKMQEEIASNVCPRCGGMLVRKTGKYGAFYGCENYPKCKFVKK